MFFKNANNTLYWVLYFVCTFTIQVLKIKSNIPRQLLAVVTHLTGVLCLRRCH